MKKLTERYKRYLLLHARKSFYHKQIRANVKFYNELIKLVPPSTLDLNNDETLKFLNNLRQASNNRKCRLYVDFKQIKTITSSCALVLASEFDRFIQIRGVIGKLKVFEFDKWKDEIKFLFRDMGIFNLLQIRNIPKYFYEEKNISPIKYFKFIKGNSVNGNDIVEFKNIVKEITSGIPNERKLQIAITEAMDNVFSHGYPDDYMYSSVLKKKLWWLSASYNQKENKLNFIFFDQGIGIPKSLKQSHSHLIGKIFDLFDDDDRLVRAATVVGRTSTGKKHRGKGLPQIIEYISSYEKNGYLRITSGKGTYSLLKKSNEKMKRRSYINNYDINGTLIEWELEL